MRGFICTTQRYNLENNKEHKPFGKFYLYGKVSDYANNDRIMIIISGRTYTSKLLTAQDLLHLYIEYGDSFIEDIAGEYSIIIVDNYKEVVLIYTDCVNTKNIFYTFLNNEIIIASRESELKKRDIKSYNKAPISSITTISINNFKVLDIKYHSKFYLNENKNTYDNCINVLEESIRVRCIGEKVSVGISSGHDSGCILQAAINTSSSISCYYVDIGTEDVAVIRDREQICKDNNIAFKTINYFENRFIYNAYEASYLRYKMEDYHDFETEPSTNLLSKLYRTIKHNGGEIYVTGLAGDEITYQYKYQIKRQNTKLFNWIPTFDKYQDGKDHNELNQNEFISEIYNIEIRYPFLDRRFIQEFLNLSVKYKENYKGVLSAFLTDYKMPYNDSKVGFSLRDSYSPTSLQKL
jgi:asparagine synthetase B (glutamine-hydrolysing)